MITLMNQRKLLKITSTIAALIIPSISFSNDLYEEELIEQLESAQATIQEIVDNKSSYSQTPLPKSREELEPLKGMWILNYNHNETAFTSTINLDEIIIPDGGDEVITGSIVINQGEPEQIIGCAKQEALLVDTLGTDFLCTTVVEPIHLYSLRFSDNTITNGFFAKGTLLSASFDLVDPIKRSPVTGSRGSGEVVTPVAPPPTGSEAIYDDATEELTIPVVNYQGSKYRVILQNQGDFVFSIKEAEVTN